MNRYAINNLFGIEGFSIAWYGIIIVCGMILAVLLAIFRAKKQGLKDDFIIDFVIWALPLGIAGARLYYVIFTWDDYKNDLLQIFATRSGGLAIYGGVIAGVLTAYFFTKRQRFSFLRFMDLAIPSLLVGQIIGRWGNFINQEAYGRLVTDPKLQFFPYSIYIDYTGTWHQATFFYESFGNLILLLLILFVIEKKCTKTGVTFSSYLIGYGILRTLIEGLREDSLYLFGSIRVSQALSMLLVLAGFALAVYCVRFRRHSDAYKGKYTIV